MIFILNMVDCCDLSYKTCSSNKIFCAGANVGSNPIFLALKQKYFGKIESKNISVNREDVGEPNCMRISDDEFETLRDISQCMCFTCFCFFRVQA
jgi:hypothetical protein